MIQGEFGPVRFDPLLKLIGKGVHIIDAMYIHIW